MGRPVDTGERPGPGDAADGESTLAALARGLRVDRPIVLVGLMGAGKTVIGRRLAAVLGLPFRDADEEIERAAGLKVAEIFARHGEPEFRRGERQVIARLLTQPPHVLATGGGAFMDPRTRSMIAERAVSVWLKAELEVLLRRVERRDDRPLLRQGNPRAVMERLMQERYPVYALADLCVESGPGPHTQVVQGVLQALAGHFAPGAPG